MQELEKIIIYEIDKIKNLKQKCNKNTSYNLISWLLICYIVILKIKFTKKSQIIS